MHADSIHTSWQWTEMKPAEENPMTVGTQEDNEFREKGFFFMVFSTLTLRHAKSWLPSTYCQFLNKELEEKGI